MMYCQIGQSAQVHGGGDGGGGGGGGVGGVGGGGGGGVKSFSCQTQLRLCQVEFWLCWGFDNLRFVY